MILKDKSERKVRKKEGKENKRKEKRGREGKDEKKKKREGEKLRHDKLYIKGHVYEIKCQEIEEKHSKMRLDKWAVVNVKTVLGNQRFVRRFKNGG